MAQSILNMYRVTKLVKKTGSPAKIQLSVSKLQAGTCKRNIWNIVGSHLVYRASEVSMKGTVRVAGFDLDDTLVKTKSGTKFLAGASDWRWFNDSVVPTLLKYQEQGYLLVIFTNQGGVVANQVNKSYQNLTGRIDNILKEIEIPFVFAATKRPKLNPASSKETHLKFRKPQAGMWHELISQLKELDLELDLKNSFYCGDAAGRLKDFSDSDLSFAKNIGLQFYLPEDLFLSVSTSEKN